MSRNGSERPGTIPESTHYGPKVCLIDKYSSSDGDLFPYGFRELGIGKLIGMRTWGGIVGISGSRPYLDGQDVRTPFFTSYSTDGDWIIENHGVDPDIWIPTSSATSIPSRTILATTPSSTRPSKFSSRSSRTGSPCPECLLTP